MISMLIAITVILYVALQLEDRLKIPSPLSLIALSFVYHYLFQGADLTGDPDHFAELVLLLLPVLLIADAMELEVEDLKKHGLSLFFLAGVAVALSVVVALFTADWFFGDYHLSTAAVIVMFSMVLATDPVSVISIFSKFSLPHELKFLAEGESLFNDATALIVFVFVGLYALEGGEITGGYIVETTLFVVLGSSLLGVACGFVGLNLLKTTENRIAELMVLLVTGYAGFTIAEHFYALLNLLGMHSHKHMSGILTCIFAAITVNHYMTREIAQDDAEISSQEELIEEQGEKKTKRSATMRALRALRITIEERARHLRSKEDVQLMALVANTLLFIAMAEIIDLDLLWRYRAEILAMFVATSLIRAVMMGSFAWLTNQTRKMRNVNFRWWIVLTFAGIKGGLSVVMLTMIPHDFPHFEMFKAVVIGVVLLSTFVYSAVLLVAIALCQEAFTREVEEERAGITEGKW
ncbi:MAG: sodium:proton antiporter [Zetaproteobacteria bacterium]|nr:MAG: sodium:proton antiporter [Zetaproteobacteria bacterium]